MQDPRTMYLVKRFLLVVVAWLCVVCVDGVGIWEGGRFVAQDSDFMRGTSYPLMGIGAVQVLAGAILYFRTNPQVARLERGLATQPSGFRAQELRRIRRINTQFALIATAESLLIGGGTVMATYGAVQHNDLLKGIGLGFVIQSVVTLTLDLFAAQRALRYTDSLFRFDATGMSVRF